MSKKCHIKRGTLITIIDLSIVLLAPVVLRVDNVSGEKMLAKKEANYTNLRLKAKYLFKAITVIVMKDTDAKLRAEITCATCMRDV